MTNGLVTSNSLSPSAQIVKEIEQRPATRRMWEGGPLRQFSETEAKSHYIAYSGPFLTGYAGSYVCDRCLRPSAGVYIVKEQHSWLCGKCKGQLRLSGGGQ